MNWKNLLALSSNGSAPLIYIIATATIHDFNLQQFLD